MFREQIPMNDRTQRETIGILAGWGSFPLEVVNALHEQGKRVVVAGVRSHADENLGRYADDFQLHGVLKIGAHIQYFARHGVSKVVFAGKIFKERILHHGRGWRDHTPDWTCFRLFSTTFLLHRHDARDDTLIGTIVAEYERKGMSILPITDVAPQLLVETGIVTKTKPKHACLKDAQFGWEIARKMGGLDVGQSITVKDQMVLGVEAIEGTDALIKRSGSVCPRGGFTLVKVAKPRQDMRFDVPTIGERTVEQMHRFGGRAIVVEANKTIFVDRPAALAMANECGISIIAMEDQLAGGLLLNERMEVSGEPQTLPMRSAYRAA